MSRGEQLVVVVPQREFVHAGAQRLGLGDGDCSRVGEGSHVGVAGGG